VLTPYVFFSFIIFICSFTQLHPQQYSNILDLTTHNHNSPKSRSTQSPFITAKTRLSLRKMVATAIFRFLSLLVIASSLALCAPLKGPVFAAENSLEERNPLVVRGNQRHHSQMRSAVTNAS
jgi:hypothetical protein